MLERRERIDPKKWVQKQYERHIKNGFRWLDSDATSRYYKKFMDSNRDTTSQIRLSGELMKIYGVTEVEAINILHGKNIGDYINKYERIKNRTPVNTKKINEELKYDV